MNDGKCFEYDERAIWLIGPTKISHLLKTTHDKAIVVAFVVLSYCKLPKFHIIQSKTCGYYI